jgi:23S rRNA pseudouridine1911/1915/1917 synthase
MADQIAGWRQVPLDRGDTGQRIDRVLQRHPSALGRWSRSRIQRLIDEGGVTVNGRLVARAAQRVGALDEVRVRMEPDRPRTRPAAEPGSLDILYEDAHLLIVDKPPGVVVHPSFGHASGTLINRILAHVQAERADASPALLSRLDKFTSGAIVVAKRREVFTALQRAMAARRVEKEYLAVVAGRPTPARGTIDLALDRDPWDRRRVTVTDRGGQPAVTRYQRLAASAIGSVRTTDARPSSVGRRTTPDDDPSPVGLFSSPVSFSSSPDVSSSLVNASSPSRRRSFSLLRCHLITGRMHQIRVHLASKGWPIVGDPVYGNRARGSPAFPRQALHAWRVSLEHPVTGIRLTIEAPIPDDLRELMRKLDLLGKSELQAIGWA